MAIYRGSTIPGTGTTATGKASDVTIDDVGGLLVSTNVEDALQEIQTSIDTDEAALATHIADTITHGTTGDIVGTSDIQTLTNKTITAAGNTLDANLEDIAGLSNADGNFIVGDGANFVAESGATARASLGLGSVATYNTGTSGTTVPLLDGTNTWSGQQDFSTSGVVLGKGTFVPTVIGSTTAGTGTYTTQTGQYTVFDDCYVFTINLAWTAHTGTGSLRIGSLPFTASASGGVSIGNMNGLSTATANRYMITAESVNSTTYIRILEHDAVTGSTSTTTLDTSVSGLTLSGVIFK